MAENIVELLTDVADAIREKKGTTDKINAQNFAEEIKNLPSGGEVAVFTDNMVDKTGGGIQSITSLTVEEGVEEIGQRAFSYFTNLKNVSFPNGLRRINHYAFLECQSIEQIVLPNTITNLETQAFAKATALKTLHIPLDAPLETLPTNLFWNSISLKKFIIPRNIRRVLSYAFEGCSGLIYVDFSNSLVVPQLGGANAFTGTTCNIIVPDALYDSWIAATNWSSLADRIVKDSEYTRPL